MKKLLNAHPALTLLLLFIAFFAVPFIFSFIGGYNPVVGYFSAVLLLLLTGLLYRWEGKSLSELGLNFKQGNIYFLPLGIIVGILFFCVLLFAQMLHNGIHIRFNKNADYTLIAGGIFILFQAVCIEELIFRGYCFKKAVDHAGIPKANLIFAFLFIVWHWIAFNAWGNYGLMLGLITTAFGHLLFSTALLRSGTLYFPIGIHLGNNWAEHYLFSASMEGPNARPSNGVLFILTGPDPRQDPSQFHVIIGYMITFICFLLFTWVIWKWPKKR
ncbi:CPBP family intramembrane glutamic endopeptidase [Compostibacter hankyongensis]|uniref:CAAX prenyl protease 2/Lysostaphin resistance protein A-like domain-containing protein n=1 Tax=Compostibacter hankyongensis TaxID=1007089 RepID=A0ABP8G9Z2_9BACT